MRSGLLLLCLHGCGKGGDDSGGATRSATTGGAPSPGDFDCADNDFACIVADDLPGVLLSASSHGDEVLMVGGSFDTREGILVRWQDDRICTEVGAADQVLWWVHVNGQDDWWAVGERGAVLRQLGADRTREDVPTEAKLFGVWDDGSSVWAVGGHIGSQPAGTGEIWRRDRVTGTWELFDTTDTVLFKIWEDWVVGDTVAARIGPDGLEAMALPNGERITTVRGRSTADDVWLVGGLANQEMLQYTGGQFVQQATPPLCVSSALMGVWTGPGEDVYVTGSGGGLARFDGAQWHCPGFPMFFEPLHAVTKHGDDVLYVGGNMLASYGPYKGAVIRQGRHPRVPVEPCP